MNEKINLKTELILNLANLLIITNEITCALSLTSTHLRHAVQSSKFSLSLSLCASLLMKVNGGWGGKIEAEMRVCLSLSLSVGTVLISLDKFIFLLLVFFRSFRFRFFDIEANDYDENI